MKNNLVEFNQQERDLINILANEWETIGPPGYLETALIAERLNISVTHAKSIIRPGKYAVGSIKKAYKKYPHVKNILPALGYGKTQIRELEQTINKTPCDLVIIGTPMDLAELIKINKPSVYITYHLKEKGRPNLKDILKDFVRKNNIKAK